MCKRQKQPYKGLCNLVGGKIEPRGNGRDAAYRELCGETGVTGLPEKETLDISTR